MWRSCQVQPSHKERAIGVVRCKKEWMLLQPLRWCCVDCVIRHERDVREEQKYMYVARTSNNRMISSGDLCCCLLPRCEALRTCRSGFLIATKCTTSVTLAMSIVLRLYVALITVTIYLGYSYVCRCPLEAGKVTYICQITLHAPWSSLIICVSNDYF